MKPINAELKSDVLDPNLPRMRKDPWDIKPVDCDSFSKQEEEQEQEEARLDLLVNVAIKNEDNDTPEKEEEKKKKLPRRPLRYYSWVQFLLAGRKQKPN